jgi:hypothetical protein
LVVIHLWQALISTAQQVQRPVAKEVVQVSSFNGARWRR